MFDYIRACWLVQRKFRTYQPQLVSIPQLGRWLAQFDPADRQILLMSLRSVVYFSEPDVKRALVRQNQALLRRLTGAGVPPSHVIYVQVDEAGSSSPATLNLLRDAAHLERTGVHFLDSKDVLGLNTRTNELGDGAIIYVDDFVASGNQLCKSRDFLAQYIVGTFSEFVLAPAVCEEALYQLGKRGITAVADHIHAKSVRPFHENGTLLSPESRDRGRAVALGMHRKWGLGYEEMATMVVTYRNAPNTMPLLFRGDLGQSPRFGLFPRTKDFPV